MIVHRVRIERDLYTGERTGEIHRTTAEQAAEFERRGVAVDLGPDETIMVVRSASGRDPYPVERLGLVTRKRRWIDEIAGLFRGRR